VGYEDGFLREKRITIKRDGTFISRNTVYDEGTPVYEDRIVIKLHSDRRGVLTFQHKNGAKKGIQGTARIGRHRIEAKGPGFSVQVYREGDQLVFDKEGEKLYGDWDRRVLKMKRVEQLAANVSRVRPPDQTPADAGALGSIFHASPPAPTAPWP
jgi:hypothetical protein